MFIVVIKCKGKTVLKRPADFGISQLVGLLLSSFVPF